MANKVVLSEKGSLKWRDGLRALGLAVGAAVVERVIDAIDQGGLSIEWRPIAVTALSTALVYVLKNWLIEPAKVITTYSSNEKAKEVAEDIK